MQIPIQIEVEVSGVAHSNTTPDLIRRRLEAIKDDPDAAQEREYLQNVLAQAE